MSWVDALLDDMLMPIPLKDALTPLAIAHALQDGLKTGQKVTFNKMGQRIEIVPA